MKTKLYKALTVLPVLFFCALPRLNAQQDYCAPATTGVEVLNAPNALSDILSNTFETGPGGASFRIARNWLLGVAHGFEMTDFKNGPVNVEIDRKPNFQKVRGKNDYIIRVTAVSDKRPANGYVYFVGGSWPGQGPVRKLNFYTPVGNIITGPWWAYTKGRPDFALLKINESGAADKDDKACFLNEPVKDFEILIIPQQENSSALTAGQVQTFYFGDKDRLEQIFNNNYLDYSPDYGVRFKGEGTRAGTSGSPIVQLNKMIVGVTSTSDEGVGGKGTTLGSQSFDTNFKNFIKDTLGADAGGIKFVEPNIEKVQVNSGKPIITPVPRTVNTRNRILQAER